MARENLLGRCQGTQGRQRLVDCLRVQSLVREEDVAQELAKCVRLEEVAYGTAIITEGSSDRDLVFILAGDFFVTKRRQVISRRTAGDHVGEMCVVDTDAPRSAHGHLRL
jgi:CRP-like cAMP-binding protein